MMLLEEKRGILPFDNEQHLVKGLEAFEHLMPFARGRVEPFVDDDSDPIVVSDDENLSGY
jgi:hypothetical protein